MATDMLSNIISAERFQNLDKLADDFWQPYRDHASSHIEYFVGRFYGAQAAQVVRPLNLVAQTIRSFLPKLVPAALSHFPEARIAGLELETMALKRLIEKDDEEQDIIANVLEPMIAEAWFTPMSVCYTGMKPGARVMEVQGIDIDPGEPFCLHVPFSRWVCDPMADSFRERQWERHGFRVPRVWMLESQAYASLTTDQIMDLPAWEESNEGRDHMSRIGNNAMVMNRDSALHDTIELRNVVFYDRSGIYEATICPQGRGPAKWLRVVKYEPDEGPDGGAYDHLAYMGVPGMLVPQALIAFTRDIAEAGDMLARKSIDSALRSKKILGYASGHEDEAKALLENAHGTMINMEDPRAGQVFDLNLMDPQLQAMLMYVKEEWNQASGSPDLLSGGGDTENTATGADIKNTRASEQVQFLTNKIMRVANKITRKRMFWFQTDPAADHVLDIRAADGEVIELAYNAKIRKGGPKDYRIKTDVASSSGTNSEITMRRTLDAMTFIDEHMESFAMGVWDLKRTLRFFSRHGASGLEEVAGDLTMLQERMMVDQAVQGLEQRAEQGGAAGRQQVAAKRGKGGSGGSGQERTMPGLRAEARAGANEPAGF